MYSSATKGWIVAQALLLLAASLLALKWWRLMMASETNFDRGLPWAGLALLLLVAVWRCRHRHSPAQAFVTSVTSLAAIVSKYVPSP